MKKSSLPLPNEAPYYAGAKPARRSRKAAWALVPLAVTAYLFGPSIFRSVAPVSVGGTDLDPWASKSYCAQPDAIFPSEGDDALKKQYEYISSADFWNATVKRISGAVQVKSESFDDLGEIGKDPRWDVFYNFHKYLEATFPLLHEKLKVEKVNTHGLLYTWQGTDEKLKPTLLMAHQDTVPVPPETISAWTYPPWSGAYDGKHVWGRGASDCKNQLIAVMETVELLLEAKFNPKRTIVLSFGMDEECSGRQGAGHLAKFLYNRYGQDGLAVIVDEGSGFEEAWGTLFAKPGTGEKGYTDVHITVRMPGGHSSVPSDHTSIGVVSELITLIEAHQYRTHLEEINPYYTQLHCGAENSPDFPKTLKKLLAKRASGHEAHDSSAINTCKAKPDRLALEAAKQGKDIQYLMQTSQAVDVIIGGIKVNALPERVTVTVNHRINVGETPQIVWDRLTDLAGAVAKKHGLALHAFDGKEEPSSINLAASATTLLVAPVTPADGDPFAIIAGTTRALYGKEVIVAPGIMTGNTDTRYYWNLTKHIFRYGPGYDPEDDKGLAGVHTINEKVSIRNHVNAVRWFTLFVRNMDEVEI